MFFSKTSTFPHVSGEHSHLVVENILLLLSEIADEASYNGNDTCLSFFVR